MKKKRKAVNDRRLMSIEDLKPAPYNPRRISDDAATGLGYSIAEFGDIGGLVWNATTGHLVCGHQRLAQLKKRGARLADGAVVTSDGGRFPVRVVEWPLPREKAANVVANNPAIGGEFTPDLDGLLGEIKANIGPEMFGELALDELIGAVGVGVPSEGEARATLAEAFGVPPFSVLDARQGYWQERKRAWLSLGIQSEIGRGGGEKLTMSKTIQRLKPSADQAAKQCPGGSMRPACDYRSRQRGDGRGRAV